jgi:hypothetical protein
VHRRVQSAGVDDVAIELNEDRGLERAFDGDAIIVVADPKRVTRVNVARDGERARSRSRRR